MSEQRWPAHWEADVVTADGGTVHVRPITPDDAERLVEFHSRQSSESIYLRFFSPRPRLSAAEVRHLTDVDLRDRVGFVALLGDDLIGVGRYDRLRASDEAEVAFFIDDEHHGRGLATILLEYLVAAARDLGIRTFFGEVLPSNRKMLGVFKQAGFETASRFADGVIEVRFDIEPSEAALAAVEGRARRAEARTVARLLEPRAVAVIGAGRRPGTIGHELFRQLIGHQFAGPAYPVNPEALHVASVRAWPSVLDVPDRVDLAVIAVPADEVLDAVEDCARAKVGALIVVSTGFAEAGDEGVERERALVALARRHGMRVLGPASLGVINTSPAIRLHATFADLDLLPGSVALSLQSGSLGVGIVERATALGLGLSSVVAVGDKVDVSGNDLLAWWADDDRTDVVLLSLASFGNPRRFRRVAPHVARRKPVVALVRDARRTDALLLGQTGVIAADSVDAMLDIAMILAWQPLPAGRRVAVIADSPGSTAFAEDTCIAAGLEPARATDLGVAAGPAEYEKAVSAALADPDVDSVLVVYAASLSPRPIEVADAVVAAIASSSRSKTVVASFPGQRLPGTLVPAGDLAVPNIGFPDAAARALAKVADHGVWRQRGEGAVATPTGVDLDAARSVVAGALADGRDRLDADEAGRLALAVGLRVAEARVVGDADEAAAVAEAIDGPVALKALGRPHGAKTEAAGVALDLHGPDDVRRAHERMVATLGDAMDEAIVQAMVPPGHDVAITVAPAPIVGAALGIGPGGALGGLLGPTARTVLPLTDVAGREVIERSGLLDVLGAEGVDAVSDVLARVAYLAEEVPEVVDVTLNPVIVGAGAAWCTDIAVGVAPYEPGPPDTIRRLE